MSNNEVDDQKTTYYRDTALFYKRSLEKIEAMTMAFVSCSKSCEDMQEALDSIRDLSRKTLEGS